MKFLSFLEKVSYGGQNRKFFYDQRDRITIQNCSSMSKFCFAISFILFFVFISSFFVDYLRARAFLFLIFFFLFAALGFIMLNISKQTDDSRRRMARRLFYLYILIIYLFGFVIGVTFDYGYDGVIFNILTILVPVVFTVSVTSTVLFLVPIHILYYIFCLTCLSHYSAMVSIIHAAVCLFSSIFIHTIALSSKVYVLAVNEQLRLMCEIDELTQLPNRRSFNHFISSAYSPNNNLNLAIADIDNFKDYNDFYGHLVGDDVLQSVSATLGKFADTNSIFVARYGGEEFVFVDNRHTATEFSKLIGDLIREVYNLNIKNTNSPIGRISLSVGIADKQGTSDFDELIEKADRALYKAKSSGKNRIVCDAL